MHSLTNAPETIEAYATRDVLTTLRSCQDAALASLAQIVLPATAVGEAGQHSLDLLRMIDLVLGERELVGA